MGKLFYNTDITCKEIVVEETHGTTYCQMRLSFDNSQCFSKMEQQAVSRVKELDMHITANDFFSLFPFHMVLNK